MQHVMQHVTASGPHRICRQRHPRSCEHTSCPLHLWLFDQPQTLAHCCAPVHCLPLCVRIARQPFLQHAACPMPCVRPFACALPLLLACNGSLTMDVQALLQIVNSAGPLQRAAANRQRLGWVRRWAVSRRADRRSGKRAAKNLAGMAVGQQVQFLNRTRARRADETITLEGPRV